MSTIHLKCGGKVLIEAADGYATVTLLTYNGKKDKYIGSVARPYPDELRNLADELIKAADEVEGKV